MSVTIGRVGSDGIELPDPEISYSGSQVTLSGTFTPPAGSATGLVDTLWLREQLLGLVGNDDEPVVPVVWSTRPQLNGYYRVTDAQASLPTGSTQGEAPFLPWGATLDRVVDYRQAPLEVFGVHGLIANGLGITGADVMTAAPSLAVDWWPGVGSTTAGTRVADNGTLQISVDPSSTLSTTYLSRLSIAPEYYYIGAARAEYGVDSTPTWRTVIGRQAFTTTEIPASNLVRISNGLVRVRPTATTLQVEWFNGTSWSTPTSFQLVQGASFNPFSFIVGRVLLCSPTEVVLRLEVTVASSAVPYIVDLRLRRGSRNVLVRIASYLSDSFGVRFSPGVAATSLTGGLRRTSNNSSGNREILISNTATTKNTSVGMLTDSTVRNSVLFGIGAEIGGSSATLQNVASLQVSEWFSAQSETQRVVAG